MIIKKKLLEKFIFFQVLLNYTETTIIVIQVDDYLESSTFSVRKLYNKSFSDDDQI